MWQNTSRVKKKLCVYVKNIIYKIAVKKWYGKDYDPRI